MSECFDIYNINESIRKRKSIRNYKTIDLEKHIVDNINDVIKLVKSEFEVDVKFKWLNIDGDLNDAKLGTYGVIKGAKNYLGVSVKKGEFDLESLGYMTEKLVLNATKLGLGTCYLGGTFKRAQFAKAMEINEDEIFPIIIPIGYAEEKSTFLDKAIRRVANSNKRKNWGDIFFLRDFSTPITEHNNLLGFKEALENVRLAPSASNKQPWRIVKVENEFHFFLSRTKGYESKLGFDIQKIDMGIAMCHFNLTCKALGLNGRFIKNEIAMNNKSENVEYIITWVKE